MGNGEPKGEESTSWASYVSNRPKLPRLARPPGRDSSGTVVVGASDPGKVAHIPRCIGLSRPRNWQRRGSLGAKGMARPMRRSIWGVCWAGAPERAEIGGDVGGLSGRRPGYTISMSIMFALSPVVTRLRRKTGASLSQAVGHGGLSEECLPRM